MTCRCFTPDRHGSKQEDISTRFADVRRLSRPQSDSQHAGVITARLRGRERDSRFTAALPAVNSSRWRREDWFLKEAPVCRKLTVPLESALKRWPQQQLCNKGRVCGCTSVCDGETRACMKSLGVSIVLLSVTIPAS